MIYTADKFVEHYGWESSVTANVLKALTDDSLAMAKAAGHNTIGDIAWHIALAPAYMVSQTGFDMPEYGWNTPEDLTVAKITGEYEKLAGMLLEQAATKTPEELEKVWRVWDMDWTTLSMMFAVVSHEIHHRGQLSVLMRQAGLTVPSIYGPNHEQTQEMMKQMEQQG
jgi:uncharacterized damage-inducible protein DinB